MSFLVKVKREEVLAFLAKPTQGFYGNYLNSSRVIYQISFEDYYGIVSQLVEVNAPVLRNDLSLYSDQLNNEDFMLRLFFYDLALANINLLNNSRVGRESSMCVPVSSKIDLKELSVKDLEEITTVSVNTIQRKSCIDDLKSKLPFRFDIEQEFNLKVLSVAILCVAVAKLGKRPFTIIK